MRHYLFFVITFLYVLQLHAQNITSRFERSNGKQSAPYQEVIAFYEKLDKQYDVIKMEEAGPSDAAYPLHVVYYSGDGNFRIKDWKDEHKMILFINNGIHPGEPDGIDASMMLLRDAAAGDIKIPDNIVLAVIPVFNIGGMLNRGSYSRANQNGPEEYGFRGSAQNLDLNRDFMKIDAKETRSLIQLFHRLDPDLFIDNHVSNGADYQHVMTLLATQHNKLGTVMGKYLHETLEPAIYKDMQKKGYDLVPYVNHWGHTPDKGWTAFYEGPRFASGFAALFQTYAFVPETHMLKPFKDRVNATYELMRSFIKLASANAADIRLSRKLERSVIRNAASLPVEWVSDTSVVTPTTFKGYEAGYKPSDVSGKPRLYYDRNKPYTIQVPLLTDYKVAHTARVPKTYIIPHGWTKAINRLKWNGVQMEQLKRDTTVLLTVYYIDNYETTQRPYEGHYLHSKIIARKEQREVRLMKGDYIISTQQRARRYLVEVLQPAAPDGLLAWGYFDAMLQQKEHYSDYVFEDEAAALLKNNAELRQQLDNKKKADTAFANDGQAQLDFVYKHSSYYEPVHLRYPVYTIE